MMKTISTQNAPAAIGPYSQAIAVNGMLFASGQIPLDPKTGTLVEGGIEEYQGCARSGGNGFFPRRQDHLFSAGYKRFCRLQ